MLWLLLIPGLIMVGLLTLWLVGERGHLMLPSTRAALASREVGQRGGVLNALHGYVYGRWSYYHGKILPTKLACEIIRLDHDIERTDLEHIIPYSTARDIVLTSSPGVTLLECPCRAAREDPCRPTQVCMLVGGGDWVLEHHPDRARRATQRDAGRRNGRRWSCSRPSTSGATSIPPTSRTRAITDSTPSATAAAVAAAGSPPCRTMGSLWWRPRVSWRKWMREPALRVGIARTRVPSARSR